MPRSSVWAIGTDLSPLMFRTVPVTVVFSPSPSMALIFFCVLNLYMLLFALSKFSWLLSVQPSWQFKQLLIKSDKASLIKADVGLFMVARRLRIRDTVALSSAVMRWYNRLLRSALWFSILFTRCNCSRTHTWIIRFFIDRHNRVGFATLQKIKIKKKNPIC